MQRIDYLINWNPNREKTWSGTGWGIYQALQQYFDVDDTDTSWQPSLLYRIKRKLKLVKNDMGLQNILFQRKKLNPSICKRQPSVVFQFAEIIKDTLGVQTYIYQDLSVNYVSWMQQNLPKVFAVSDFQDLEATAISRRQMLQDDYYKTCSGIFCMGEWLRQDFIKRMGISAQRVHAIGGGINLHISNIQEYKRSSNKILFIGRNFIRKGGHLVYKAFSQLRQFNDNVELYVAGPQSNPITHPIDGYHFLGDINHNQLSDYFNICDIFVMPSYFEAYGLVFIEALTYGLPCIGRNCYEMPYFIQDGETGYLIDSDDAESLAHKMHQLLNDEKIKTNVRNKRQWYIENYTWDAVAQRVKKILG